jgi:DNA (cytosine-5)-methyltransferase 1
MISNISDTGYKEIVIDSFAGGGGASLGIEMATGRSPDIAINHDAEAIAMHAANHPATKHYCESVWKVDPVEACAGRPVGLMWASPDCKHFSKAKGGKPVSKKIRGLAWAVTRWAKAVHPRVICLENVEEFQTWGPLGDDGMPDKSRRGDTFHSFVRRLQRLGYEVQWRELRACDYGAPTIRKRLFLVARCDGQPIVWPKATHGKGRAHPWRTAAECIDWSIPCPSIFERKKPLAENTLKRIARGVRRYVIESPRPFIVVNTSGHTGASLADPMPTVTTGGHHMIAAPYIVPLTHHGSDRIEAIDAPMATVTGAHRGEKALIVPTLIQTGYGEDKHRNAGAGQPPRSLDLHQPLGTVVGGGVKHALVSAMLAKHYGGHENDGQELTLPLSTVTTQDHHALIASTLVNLRGTEDSHLHGNSIEAPLPTISAGGLHAAEVRAFLVAYYGNEKEGATLFDPMRTVTSKERFGLVTVEGAEYLIADIGMRMLAPRELARAQGFPDSYKLDIPFDGKPLTKTAQVRMIGNSVVPQCAAALVSANYAEIRDVVRAA